MSPETPKDRSAPEDLYQLWAEEDRDEDKSLRFSFAAAVLVHALLLLITFPQIYTEELAEPETKDVIKLAPTPRFRPPPICPSTEPPKPRVRKIPIPDPDPDDPEPFVVEEERVEIDLPDVDDLSLGIPERPPEPESTTPLVVGGDVRAPVRLNYVAPRYPELARRVHLGGTVVLRAVIDREGKITEIKVVKSLGFGLTEAAVEAIEQWKFSPGTLRGKPVAVFYQLEVKFEVR